MRATAMSRRRDRRAGDRRRADRGASAPGWALAIDAATFAVSALFLARLRLPAARRAREPTSFLADLREGWGVFRSLTWVWTFVLGGGVREHALGRVERARAGVAERDLGGAAAWGTVLGGDGRRRADRQR